MRKCLAVVTGMALLVGSAVPATAAPPPVASAASGWQVDYGDERCVALRRFSVAGNGLLLAIEPDIDGRGARFLFRPDKPSSSAFPGRHQGRLSIDGRQVGQGLVIWPTTPSGVLLMSGFVLGDDDAPLALADAKQVTLQSNPLNVTIPIGGMSKVAPLLADCAADLLDRWGFSRAEQARMAEPPHGRFMRFFQADDYPLKSRMAGAQGEVSVRYWVGADGKARDCKVRIPSGDPALDARTCEIFNQRVRLTPAHDRAGVAMAAMQTARVRWVMPGF